MRESSQTAGKFGKSNSEPSMKRDTELNEVKDKLSALHNSTLEVEHKLTKTENRLQIVIQEILQSRQYVHVFQR